MQLGLAKTVADTMHLSEMEGHQSPRRAVVTLVARGPGHGIRPWKTVRAEDAEERASGFVTSGCALACSYRRWRTREHPIPFVVLAVNLTHEEMEHLQGCGADRTIDVSIGFDARQFAPPWIRNSGLPVTPPWRDDCTGIDHGNTSTSRGPTSSQNWCVRATPRGFESRLTPHTRIFLLPGFT
jgi:hypothetical protein